MTPTLWTVDAHCHWTDKRIYGQAETEIPRLIAGGISGFLLGGVDPEDWGRQTALHAKFPKAVWRSFGLHPYFVNGGDRGQLETAWEKLSLMAPDAEALGETGLDFRKHFLERDLQIEYFRRQLELAQRLGKPVVLHIVRAHQEALKELRDFKLSGMVHAFSANAKIARHYLDLGYHLSIGARILYNNNDLADTVKAAPLQCLLTESDCPDQPPPGQTSHDSTTVWSVAAMIAELKNVPLQEVVEQTRDNLLRLIGRTENGNGGTRI